MDFDRPSRETLLEVSERVKGSAYLSNLQRGYRAPLNLSRPVVGSGSEQDGAMQVTDLRSTSEGKESFDWERGRGKRGMRGEVVGALGSLLSCKSDRTSQR